MTKANWITIARIMLFPFVLVILLTEMQHKEIIAFIIFVTASVTDSLDGYVARKFDQVTDLGKFLDPLADKLLITAALIALVYLQEVETWAAALIVLREIFISAFRFYYLVNNASFSASIAAKLKTTMQVIAISVLIIYPKLPWPGFFQTLGTILLYVAVVLTVYSGIEYVWKYSLQHEK
ncbi:MAG TPA: CDP-diacylglycerol--glycerol-3-phosphate 3-phosphatidyltransferase [Candidatus Aminicenantes bacterium]|nr:CDP-diacylglycerol--glycerol-3-phosphate 3-phosphatidyltransferase [Candidatus Aminicenantes bacterium]